MKKPFFLCQLAEEPESLFPLVPNGQLWPKISIVTPSYNQGQYIEETIRSVLLQNYPNLEYIIIDGGSKDESVDIIKKYEPQLAYWVSEKDKGQAHALNKGFAHATGEVFCYLNSDDVLHEGVLVQVAARFASDCNLRLLSCAGTFFGPAIAVGQCASTNSDGNPKAVDWIPPDEQFLTDWLSTHASLFQPATFWRCGLHRQVGGFREDLDFCFDKAFFLRCLFEYAAYTPCPEILAAGHRLHDACKTVSIPAVMEEENELLWCEFREQPWCRTILAWEARCRQARSMVAGVLELNSPLKRMNCLLRAAIMWPGILSSRMYWGAARRLLAH